jgi:hypothetical protein
METSINMPAGQRTNWSMILRVGVVSVLLLGLVGYAMKVTYESVILKGVVNKGDYFQVELKAMSNFDMDPRLGSVEDVGPEFRRLDGKKVLLVGQVAPTGFSAGPKVDRFQICYSVATCCLSGTPKAQHFVSCRAPAGKLLENYESSTNVQVLGTLHIRVIKDKDGGSISSIFQMDVDRVEPVS